MRALRRVLVVGTGLIGTSVALALRRAGIEVTLTDRAPGRLALAVDLGAGRPASPGDPPVDHAVLAVPPAAVAAALADLQRSGRAEGASDVAGVKVVPLAAAAAAGCDLSRFVGGHPIAGRERSGPAAAHPDLFRGRPWVLTPTAETATATLVAGRAVAELCGAVPLVLTPAAHDAALALTSHLPQFVASTLAAQLADVDPQVLAVSGQGLRDLVRIAGSDPQLWTQIAAANAGPLADLLDRVASDLTAVATALRSGDALPAETLLRQGVAGQARLPGKHNRPAAPYAVVPVVLPDEPGALARLFADAADVNVEEVTIDHAPGAPYGVIRLSVLPEAASRLAELLARQGWAVHPPEEGPGVP